MKPTLLILAAGMGSRYGGLKQIDPMGPHGETLMEYGIYDAIKAGFKKAVFLFRDDIIQAFEQKYTKLKSHIELDYAFQDINPRVGKDGLSYTTRTKPWGTAHAILCAAAAIDQPFAVINADDFYGPSAYKEIITFLTSRQPQEASYAVVGYPIEKTLSPQGRVSRATLACDTEGYLTEVVERTHVETLANGIHYKLDNNYYPIPHGTLVSTNFWGFTPAIFPELEKQFEVFVRENHQNPKSEFFIPSVVNDLINNQQATVRVLSCEDDWMGVTYKEDKQAVTAKINELISRGVYPSSLWS